MEAVSNYGHDNSFGRRACLWSGGGAFDAGCTRAGSAGSAGGFRFSRCTRSGRATGCTSAGSAGSAGGFRFSRGARGARTNSEARTRA